MIDHNNDAERVEREKAYLKTNRVTAGSVAGNGKGVTCDPCDKNPEKSVVVFDQTLKDYELAFKGNETSLADVEKALAAQRNSQDEMPMPLPPVPKTEQEAPQDDWLEECVRKGQQADAELQARNEFEYIAPGGMDLHGWVHPENSNQYGGGPPAHLL